MISSVLSLAATNLVLEQVTQALWVSHSHLWNEEKIGAEQSSSFGSECMGFSYT